MRITGVLCVVLLLLGGAISAFADSVNIANVTGCFANGSCSTFTDPAYYDSSNQDLLKFNGANPSGVNINTSPYFYQVKLGTFSSKDLLDATLGGNFTAHITFTAPAGTVPPDWDVTADVTGNVTLRDSTNVFIDFPNYSQEFNYDYMVGSVHHTGTFYVNVDDVSFGISDSDHAYDTASAVWYGNVTSSPVPEPGSMLLLCSGLLGVAQKLRMMKR